MIISANLGQKPVGQKSDHLRGANDIKYNFRNFVKDNIVLTVHFLLKEDVLLKDNTLPEFNFW